VTNSLCEADSRDAILAVAPAPRAVGQTDEPTAMTPAQSFGPARLAGTWESPWTHCAGPRPGA